MGKEKLTIKENDSIKVDANVYTGKNGKKELFIDMMDKIHGIVEFYLSQKVSAAFAIYIKKHNTMDTDVNTKMAIRGWGAGNDSYFDNIELNTPYDDQDFLCKVMDQIASRITAIILESDNVYEELLKVLILIQGVLLTETVVYINDEPIPDAIVERTAAMKNRTLN